MSGASAPLLLDANVLVFVVRGGAVAEKIDQAVDLRARLDRAFVSAVAVGEALAMAERRGWGETKCSTLRALVENLVVVELPDTVRREYAAIDTFQKSKGLNLGQNDMWIAATARALDACLVTTDKDFDSLAGTYVDRVFVDPASALPPSDSTP